MTGIRESKLERKFVRAIKITGGMALKFVSPGRRNVPDRIVLWPLSTSDVYSARVDFVELKKPCEKPTAAQIREHERLRKKGFGVFIIDSVNQISDYIRLRA